MKKLISKLGFDEKTFIHFFLIVSNSQMIYAFYDLKSVLYDPLLETLNVTNTEFGVLLGLVGLVTTFGGAAVGWLQDRFSIRKVLAVNSFMYGAWALIMALWPGCPYELKCLFFIAIGFNGDAMYWATVLKSVRIIAREDRQATAFGMLECGRAIWAFLLSSLSVILYTVLGSTVFGMQTVMGINGTITILSGLVIWMFIPEQLGRQSAEQKAEATLSADNNEVTKGKTRKAFDGLIRALKMPEVWMTGGSAMCIYAVSCAAFTYFAPYLKNAYFLPAALVGVFGVFNGAGMRIIAGPVAGIITDMKFKSSAHMMKTCHIGVFLLLVVALLLPKKETFIIPAMVCLIVITLLVSLVRSVYYAPIGELGIPEEMSAAVMAIAACIGYSPSFWAYPLYGWLIDQFEAAKAYSIIFAVLLVMTFTGAILNMALGKKIVARRERIACAK